jgi:replicative DNA helicase
LCLNFALKAAQAGHQVGVFSLEMSRERLIRRIWANIGSINGERINQVRLTPSEWASLYQCQDKLDLLPLWIDGPPVLSISQLRVQARRERSRGRLDLLIVDYLQKIRPATPGRSREEEVAEVTRGLKSLAKELKIPVLALCTLNREVEKRTNKRPMLSDLRESGSIEYEADIVLFLYRDEKYDEESQDKGKVELIVEKNRNGRIGTVKLAFKDFFQRFMDLYEA